MAINKQKKTNNISAKEKVRKVMFSSYLSDLLVFNRADAGNKPIIFGDFSFYWLIERKRQLHQRVADIRKSMRKYPKRLKVSHRV